MTRRDRQLAHARAALEAARELIAQGRPWAASTRAAWGIGAVRTAQPEPGEPEAYALLCELTRIRDAV